LQIYKTEIGKKINHRAKNIYSKSTE